IRLDAGEYRWFPIHVSHAPVEVTCRFRVVKGTATVHAELAPRSEFRAFIRRRSYGKLVATGETANGFFSQVLSEPGDYAVILINAENAPQALVSFSIESRLNPTSPGIARTLPPERRLVVILISFAIFFASAGWSGHRLIRAMKKD
ncbi:MAG TPA: hypothetical protein VG345_01225, partial [Bryobacteraceae bacterium]|nr:hypothetical protein [Bryobacteraceae bacterium]